MSANANSHATYCQDQEAVDQAELKLSEHRYGEEADCYTHLMDKAKVLFTIAGIPIGLGLARPGEVMSCLRAAGEPRCHQALYLFAAMYALFFLAMLLALVVLYPKTVHTPANPKTVQEKLRGHTRATVTKSLSKTYADAAEYNQKVNRRLGWVLRISLFLCVLGYVSVAVFLWVYSSMLLHQPFAKGAG